MLSDFRSLCKMAEWCRNLIPLAVSSRHLIFRVEENECVFMHVVRLPKGKNSMTMDSFPGIFTAPMKLTICGHLMVSKIRISLARNSCVEKPV